MRNVGGKAITTPCAAVAIGRNEGDRLRRCLESLRGATPLVYVDSGSTDDSLVLARSLGASVVELDMSRPFTAARARNAGFARVLELDPEASVVQFVDGDCEVRAGWLDEALAFLASRPDVAAVCGRVRERHPERSIYNRLCDLEWDTPVGEARACGGNAMLRVAPLRDSGGFRDDLIAGEEPELCVRLRAAGWRVWRHEGEMVLHDAAMTRFSQWWRRTQRAGYAFVEGAHLHGAPPERHWVRETLSARVWAPGVPLLALAAVVAFGAPGALVLLVYPLQVLRVAARVDGPLRVRLLRGLFIVLGKFAELAGQARWLALRLRGRRAALIEYK